MTAKRRCQTQVMISTGKDRFNIFTGKDNVQVDMASSRQVPSSKQVTDVVRLVNNMDTIQEVMEVNMASSKQVPSSMQVPSSKQVTEVVRQGDYMDTIQEVMEVDMVTESAVDSVWCQWRQDKENQTSDKSRSCADYWANEILVSGAGVAGGQTQQHHLQGGVVADQQHQLPGHVGIVQSGHMKDIPGKPNIIPNLIVPLPGSSQQEEDGVTGAVRGGHPGGVQHECDNSNGQGEVQVQQDVRGDKGATHVQQQHGVGAHGHREQQVGGHHDEDQGGVQVHGGVWDGAEGGGARKKVLGGRRSVLARVRDGYGNPPQKRRYWRY